MQSGLSSRVLRVCSKVSPCQHLNSVRNMHVSNKLSPYFAPSSRGTHVCLHELCEKRHTKRAPNSTRG
jgi:aspartate carbamoyltransferase regulatory subunit